MLRVIGVIILLYAAFVLAVWALQGRLLYMPDAIGEGFEESPADLGLEYEEVRFAAAEDGVELHGWFVPSERERATLLFFHGNAGNISHRLDLIQLFHRLDLSVFLIDYRGYGRSDGRPSEAGTARDARGAWRWLTEEAGRSPEEIVIAGRSLGAAVGAELAQAHRPGAAIVESSFRSVPQIAQEVYPFLPARWLARFDYATEAYVRGIEAPLLVIHSRDDEIIPYAHGEAVYAAASQPKTLLTIRGGHNTGFLESANRYLEGIDRFLDEAGLQRPESSRSAQ